MRISDWSSDVCSSDLLIGGFSLLILFLAGPVFILIFAFAIRYRRGKQVNRDHPPNRNVWLETSWSHIPFLLILGFFILSAKIFFTINHPPDGALPIRVVPNHCMWKFKHHDGQAETHILPVQIGRNLV